LSEWEVSGSPPVAAPSGNSAGSFDFAQDDSFIIRIPSFLRNFAFELRHLISAKRIGWKTNTVHAIIETAHVVSFRKNRVVLLARRPALEQPHFNVGSHL
jgi:hypothetical protein